MVGEALHALRCHGLYELSSRVLGRDNVHRLVEQLALHDVVLVQVHDDVDFLRGLDDVVLPL